MHPFSINKGVKTVDRHCSKYVFLEKCKEIREEMSKCGWISSLIPIINICCNPNHNVLDIYDHSVQVLFDISKTELDIQYNNLEELEK